MFTDSWWENIPTRVDLKKANFQAINNETSALRNHEINVNELSTDGFIGMYLTTLFVSEFVEEKDFREALVFELIKRSEDNNSTSDSAFKISGITHEEMELRAKRVRMTLATLRGIDGLNSNPGFPDRETYDFYFIQDLQCKYLESLTDDEIAELAAIAESWQISWLPAHKEILI